MKIGFLNFFFFCHIYIRFFNLTMIGEQPEQKEAKQNNNWNGMEDPLARRPGQWNLLHLLGIEMKIVNRKISHVIHLFWWTQLLHLYWLLLVHVDDAVLTTSMCSRWAWRGSLLHLRERESDWGFCNGVWEGWRGIVNLKLKGLDV